MAWSLQLRGPMVQIWSLCSFSPNVLGFVECSVVIWECGSAHLWSQPCLCLPRGQHRWVWGDQCCGLHRVRGGMRGTGHLAKNDTPQKNAFKYSKICDWGTIGYWSSISCQYVVTLPLPGEELCSPHSVLPPGNGTVSWSPGAHLGRTLSFPEKFGIAGMSLDSFLPFSLNSY